MQVVAKTHRIELMITGDIPENILRVLEEEYGSLQIVTGQDDELVEVVNTDWYSNVKPAITPGETLRAYREKAALTQEALGRKIGGVPRQHISGMETGRRPIGKEMAKKLASALNMSPIKFY